VLDELVVSLPLLLLLDEDSVEVTHTPPSQVPAEQPHIMIPPHPSCTSPHVPWTHDASAQPH
jgi:hypothetical protein